MPTTPSAKDLAAQLENSMSTTIYVEADMTDADAAKLLTADPPLHAELDLVRGLWAVRKATDDEVLTAAAAAETAAATTSTSKTSNATSSSSTPTPA